MKTNLTSKAMFRIAAVMVVLTFINAQVVFGQKTTSKISGDMPGTEKVSKARTNAFKSASDADLFSKSDLIITTEKGDYVLIEALSDGNAENLLTELKKIGLKEGQVHGRNVNGYLPVTAVNKLEGVKPLVFVSPVYRPVLNSGAAYSNGDAALRANVVRENKGLDGRGIKVGVLSDSYNSLGGADEGVEGGELPGAVNPNGYSAEVTVLEDIEGGSDEGRAMCEIIHDVAPGAELAFHTAFTGQAGFAQGILGLAEAGCDVITDDVSYFTEPFFQDGIIAQAVEYVVEEEGVAYYSSAGNGDRDSYESEFRNGGVYTVANPYGGYLLGDYVLHDFDPGEEVDVWQEVTFMPNSNLTLAFQWDDPFASVCSDCPGADTDMDIVLALSPDPFDVILESANFNIGADAYEILGASYSGTEPFTAYVAIGKWIDAPGDNPDPGFIKYINYGSAPVTEYFTGAPTNMGHSNTENGIGVGAVAWFNTPEFGDDPAIVNSFSSAGGIKILYDTEGKRIKRPKERMNPRFTATDGGNTSFFGFLLNDGDDFPNFFGTSASAPHTAAVAAQLLQMADGKLGEKEINSILASTALDMDDPYTEGFDKGFDFKTGYGLIQADLAADEVFKRVGIENIFPYAECSDDPDAVRKWRINNPNNFAVEVGWEVIDTDQEGTILAQPGDSYIETTTREWYNLLMVSFDGPWGGTRKIAAYSPGETCGSFKNAITSNENIEPTLIIGAYPNPVADVLKLDLYSGSESGYVVKIYNIEGREVYSNDIAPISQFATLEFNVSELVPGMYILKLVSNDGAAVDTYKIVK